MYTPFPWLGFIFWCGLFIWFGTMAWARFLSERERQKTLRAFAERGTPLDKEVMQKLFPTAPWRQNQPDWRPSPEGTARGLMIGGIVCAFAGVGLLIGAQLVGQIEREALFGMSAGGAMAGCVGLGLITASRVILRMHARDKDQVVDAGDDAR